MQEPNQLIEPIGNTPLVANPDGTFQSEYTGKPFMYDAGRDSFVPLYVPDDSGELAHIENGSLVANETDRRFDIDTDGTILTPEEISFREIKQKENERFAQMEEDGSIENYLDQAKKRKELMQDRTPLSIEDIRRILNGELPSNIDALKDLKDAVQQVTFLAPEESDHHR